MTLLRKTYGGWAKLLGRTTQENPNTKMYLHDVAYGADPEVTAATGSSQSTGYKVTKTFTEIGTCGNAGDALTLPQCTIVGTVYHIKNNGANSADIFPPVGGDCDAAGANTAVAVANTAKNSFVLMSYTSTPTSVWVTF